MKFKIYNSANSPHTKVAHGYHESHVTVCRNGNVMLNSHLLRLLKNPDSVIIAEDEAYPGDFYIVASKDPSAFFLGSADKRLSRSFSSSTLADKLAESVGAKGQFIVPVDENGISMEIGMAYPLAVKKVRLIPRRPCKIR